MLVGSLFSGIGGLDLGLARAGFRHAFFCESDPWRRSVLAQHWPGVPIYEDVADVGRDGSRELGTGTTDAVRARREGSPHVDLIAGGFPCQDVSVAGRRAGLAGERSGLFYEFARIAESLRPRWVLVENVPGLLSSNGGRDFGAVLGTLADIGYGLAWRILDSRYFGVPQRRRRVFILGAFAGGDPRGAAERAGEILAVGSRCERHPATRGEAGEDVALPLGSRTNNGRGGGTRYDLDNDTYVAVTHSGGETVKSAAISQTVNGQVGSESTAFFNGVFQGAGVRRLTPTECERLQNLPDDWTAHGPDSRRYAALGDAVTASVSEYIGRRLIAA